MYLFASKESPPLASQARALENALEVPVEEFWPLLPYAALTEPEKTYEEKETAAEAFIDLDLSEAVLPAMVELSSDAKRRPPSW